MPNSLHTNYTLLERAIDLGDDAAWQELIAQYRRFIPYVLRGMGVPVDDVDDLTQQILVRLSQNIHKYDRERARFRTWLSTMIRNMALNFFDKERRNMASPSELDVSEVGTGIPSAAELDTLVEREWEAYISTVAMERVREAFKGRAVEVFELMLDGMAAGDVAQRTGLTVSTVYTLNKRVKQRLYIEIRALIQELE